MSSDLASAPEVYVCKIWGHKVALKLVLKMHPIQRHTEVS